MKIAKSNATDWLLRQLVTSVFAFSPGLAAAASGASASPRCEALFQSMPLDSRLAAHNLVRLRNDIQELAGNTHTALKVRLEQDFVKGRQDLLVRVGSESKLRELFRAAETEFQQSRRTEDDHRQEQILKTQQTLNATTVPSVKSITPISRFRLDRLAWDRKRRPNLKSAEIKDLAFAPAGAWGAIELKTLELVLFHPELSEPVILRDSRGVNDFFRFSPKGDFLLYAKDNQTFLLKLGSDGRITAQPLSRKLAQPFDGVVSPMFSTDGQKASMWVQGELIVIHLSTGQVHRPIQEDLPSMGSSGDYVVVHDRALHAWVWSSATATMAQLPQKLPDQPMSASVISAQGILIQLERRRFVHVDPISLAQTPIAGSWSDVKLDPDGKYAMMKDYETNEWSVLDMATGMIIRQLGFKGFHAAWGPSGRMLIYDVLTYASTDSLDGPVTVQNTPAGMSIPIWTAGPAISFQNTRQLHPPLSDVAVSRVIDAPMGLEWVSPWTHGALTAANPSRGGGLIILEPKDSKALILHQAAHPKNDLIVPVTPQVAGKPVTSADDRYVIIPVRQKGQLGFELFKISY